MKYMNLGKVEFEGRKTLELDTEGTEDFIEMIVEVNRQEFDSSADELTSDEKSLKASFNELWEQLPNRG